MKIGISEAIEVLNDMLRNDTESITQDQADAIKEGLKALKDAHKFILANVELAKINATLIEFATEVSYTPYSDSNYLSLYEGLRTRATVILQDITSAQHGVHLTPRHAATESDKS